MRSVTTTTLATAVLALSHSVAAAQVPEPSASVSVGPQVSLLGVGVGASVKIGDKFSLSGEFGFLPIGEIDLDADDIEYAINPNISGGILAVNFHPFGNNLSIGVGMLLGGYNADGETKDTSGTIRVGDQDFLVEDVGNIQGDFSLDGPAPALMLGWRGKAFNLGIGIAFADSPELDLSATG